MIGTVRHLLVATDGSENGSKAVSFAIAMAATYGSKLLLCTSIDYGRAFAECSNVNGSVSLLEPLVSELEISAKEILTRASQRTSAAQVEATSVVLSGRPAAAIVECALERHVDAIVLGSSGKRGPERFFLGSVAEEVLRQTVVPAFVVPPGDDGSRFAFDRVVVAVDDSEPSDAAAVFALDLAGATQANVTFTSVAETTDLLDKADLFGYDPAPMREQIHSATAALLAVETQRALAKHIVIETVVSEGAPAKQILETADSRRADLIIVGSHGRRGLRRLFLGSVAENVVRRSRVPVAVVRTLDARRTTVAPTSTRASVSADLNEHRPQPHPLENQIAIDKRRLLK